MTSALRLSIACSAAALGSWALVAAQAPSAPAAAPSANAPALRLGTVDFPASGSPEAQPHFQYGIAALHSFWYEEAIEAFQKALAIDPQFAMAHWGIAMCYDRSYRPGSDPAAGRAALAKIGDTTKLTARERDYIGAAQKLFGTSGSVKRNDQIAAMEKLLTANPDDQETKAFLALALISARGRANMDRAAKLAQEVYDKNPQHPGAAHYIIHAYDAPDHAKLALHAADHYARIAPDAPHALHMPSHIYVQLGMWKEAHDSNRAGWSSSVDYVKRKSLTPTLRDYHNLHWLIYASLQEGRYAQATKLVDDFLRMRRDNELASYSARYINEAFANYLVETRNWARSAELFPAAAADTTKQPAGRAPVELCGAEPESTAKEKSGKIVLTKTTSSAPSTADIATFMRAFSAAALGAAKEKPDTSAGARSGQIRALQISAMVDTQAQKYASAIESLNEASDLEAQASRPIGPASGKPAHEQLGEVLLLAGKPAKAVDAFKKALERHPNRPLALLGLARAEAASGKKDAARKSYERLLTVWERADADLPELKEAKDFVRAAG